jgi:hypothetical protein
MSRVADELRSGPDLPEVPVIVLTALGPDATQAALWGAETLRTINAAKTALHAGLAASVPRGEQRIIHDVGHGWLHEQRQADVVKAIDAILRRIP